MTDKKDSQLTYEQLQERKNDLIESFNKVALNMINHLGEKFPDSIFGKNNTLIKNFFKFKPKETMILFLENVYESDIYRKEISSKNDKFFMEHTYDGAINAGYEMRIFEFKDLWMRMTSQTKTIVKDSMAMLVDHTTLYLDIVSQMNKVKK
jgi:hypothetical protein